MRHCVFMSGMCQLSINGTFKTHDRRCSCDGFDQSMNLGRAGDHSLETRAKHQAQAPRKEQDGVPLMLERCGEVSGCGAGTSLGRQRLAPFFSSSSCRLGLLGASARSWERQRAQDSF